MTSLQHLDVGFGFALKGEGYKFLWRVKIGTNRVQNNEIC